MMWQGIDREGVRIVIDADAWLRHILKHPEVAPFFDAVVATMIDPGWVFPDTRPDEANRYFRRLYRAGMLTDYFSQHYVRVAVKYVHQAGGPFVGFYSSSWFQRDILEPQAALERIHPFHVD